MEAFNKGVFKEFVTRTMAVPNGLWRFPAVKSDPQGPVEIGISEVDGFLDDASQTPSIVSQGGEGKDELFDGEVDPAPIAGDAPKTEPLRRNRAITSYRIAIFGKTKGCEGCKSGTYSHTPECRKRFNELLDRCEPKIVRPKRTKDDEDILGLDSPITGALVTSAVDSLEKGQDAVASIYLDFLDHGVGNEEDVSGKLAMLMQVPPKTVENKRKPRNIQKRWFVEFCCSAESSCKQVAEKLGLNYLGLSEEFGDLTDDQVFEQVEFWFQERMNLGEPIDLWGSIPCGPYSPLQHLNIAKQGEEFLVKLGKSREVTGVLLDRFATLAMIAEGSGGTISFEWPKGCEGWPLDEVIQMVVQFDMVSSYPSGCGFGLVIDGKRPLKPWRVVTTSKRLAAQMHRFRCKHPPGFRHDPIEGGRMASQSGLYNKKMATAILTALYPEVTNRGVPSMPTFQGAIAHEEKGLIMAQLALALVHQPISRSQLLNHPEGKTKIKEEADSMRALKVWDEQNEFGEVDQIMREARKKGVAIHMAEMMLIGSIKNAEMTKEHQKLKVRLVFRGDDTRNAHGEAAVFRELKSLPASVATVNLVLWYGLRQGHVVRIADATKAYLQAPIRSATPTYVILPKEIWRPQWFPRYQKVAGRLLKAMYGHPTSGDDWAFFFDGILTSSLKANRVEGFPSLWYIKEWDTLVAAYVDDIVVAGSVHSVAKFWEQIQKHITIDAVTEPGRYLGRDHVIFEFNNGRRVLMSMADYAMSAFKLYEDQFGQVLRTYETPFVSEAVLTPDGYEKPGQLASNAAQLLMKLLWLARLSRPDISYAITILAGVISKWTLNHDIMLYRLLGYVKHTFQMGLYGQVSTQTEIPRLHLFCDADLAGDPLSMKSHSGIFVVLQCESGTFFPLSWSAKKQTAVSRSTTEAEIVAANEIVFNEGIPVATVLELILGSEVETILQEDDSAVSVILKTGYSPKLRSLNRTHRISVAALSDAIQQRLIQVRQTLTEDQLADIFTKAMPRLKFLSAREAIGVNDPPKK